MQTRFGWRHDLADYGPPRFACTPAEWKSLCRLHQDVSSGTRSEWPEGPEPAPLRWQFARYLFRTGRIST